MIDLLAEHGLKRGENGLQVDHDVRAALQRRDRRPVPRLLRRVLHRLQRHDPADPRVWTATPPWSPPASTNATPPSCTCSRWPSPPARSAASTSASAGKDPPTTPTSPSGSSSKASIRCPSTRTPSSTPGCGWAGSCRLGHSLMAKAAGPPTGAPMPSSELATYTGHATPESGLNAAQVAERVAAGRVNAVETPTSRTFGQIIRANVLTPFNGLDRRPGRDHLVHRSLAERPVRPGDHRQQRHRRLPGATGQADPRPAGGSQRSARRRWSGTGSHARWPWARWWPTTSSSCVPAIRSSPTAWSDRPRASRSTSRCSPANPTRSQSRRHPGAVRIDRGGRTGPLPGHRGGVGGLRDPTDQ